MNLIIALMVTRQFLPKSRIRDVVSGYAGQSDEAFERMFERDKRELRELGIVLESGTYDAVFDDEEGYRIRRDDVELPGIDLSVQETALLSLAAHVWDHMGMAAETTSAVAKLKAAGVTIDTDAFAFTKPSLAAAEPGFDAVWNAVTERRPIRFEYRRPRSRPGLRHVQPWAIVSWHGRWYLIAHDTDRGDTRWFRLSRITGPVESDGPARGYRIPDDIDVQDLASTMFAGTPPNTAQVLIRKGRGVGLRRAAEETEQASADTDRLTIRYWDAVEIASDIASLAEDAYVEEPDEVRQQVIHLLRAGVDADDIA